ncbi:MAG TPA: DUF5010 domain-containing protein [Polyangia bacterium]|nr:DUF5010 domain-containing protein [Polyangia bacterium]
MKAVALLGLVCAGCAVGGYGTAHPDAGAGGTGGHATSTGGTIAATAGSTGGGGTTTTLPPATATPMFGPRADFDGPCARVAGAIDVNLGNAPEAFVRAAYCQINGAEPPADVVSQWATQLRTVEYVRRVDVVRSLCQTAKRSCTLSYSDPWQADIPVTPTCTRKTTRDLGAVLMFFSDCPRGVNCGMDWANTHAHGMDTPHPLLGFGSVPANYYNPRNPGWWSRELADAKWAGLQFFLVNTYGPDLSGSPDPLAMLGQALAQAGDDSVKVALFDDPWAWGQPSSSGAFRTRPDLSQTEAAAQAIYTAKWKPFYSRIDPKHWYTFRGRPFVYFYNAGTLNPLNVSAAVVARLKALFAADFKVTPFVVVETAYFQDPAMPTVADSQFTWNSLTANPRIRSTLGGFKIDHFMVRWDPVGRDKPGVIASAGDRLIKGTSLLQQRLTDSSDADVAVVATWNDLGEGTGIERNYDYYLAGAWSPPTTFMSLTRAAQCGD